MARPCFTCVHVALLQVAAFAQEPALEVRIDAIGLDAYLPRATITLHNRGDRPLAYCAPVDGSTYAWVMPHYEFRLERRGNEAPKPGRCGNHSPGWDENYLQVLAPGARTTLEITVPALLVPGTWHATLHYRIDAGDGVGPKTEQLAVGEFVSTPFTFLVPGPTWDEWNELPSDQLEAKLADELASSDAAAVGMAVDAALALASTPDHPSLTPRIRTLMVTAVATLTTGVLAATPQRYDPSADLSRQLAALLASPLLPLPETRRDEVRSAFVLGAGKPGRQALLSALALAPTPSDLPMLDRAVAKPDGDGETLRLALEMIASVRDKDAAIDAGLRTLLATPAGEQFMAYAHAVSHVSGVYEPSQIRFPEGGTAYPSEPAQHKRAKQQWAAWARARAKR